jgi:NDP-sugar pyrophosphorylase family protein/aminoglycoside/choline kinase family phosphotransferase
MKINAFILAAGLGERLRPITERIPKPLLPVCGRPVISYVLEKLERLNPEKIGINLHYRAEAIAEWINTHPLNDKIELFYEDPILGTGGALKNARRLLSDYPFIVHNGDILTDIDLTEALNFHLSSDNIVTLLIHDCPEFNKLIVSKDGRLKGLLDKASHGASHKAFTGIAIYSPEFLELLPEGYSSVVDAWLDAIKKGFKIGTFDITGSFWGDIGTPDSYARTVFAFLKNEGETVYVDPSISTDHIEVKGYVSIEKGSIIKEGSSLRNAIVLGGNVEGVIENIIIGDSFSVKISESRIFELHQVLLSPPTEGILIGTGGSDRRYFRTPQPDGYVLMKCKDDDPDFLRHIEYSEFLHNNGISVPRLIDYNEASKTALFEDLGDLNLYSWLKGKKDLLVIEEMYKRVIDELLRLHSIPSSEYKRLSTLLVAKVTVRVFDYWHFRWETDYFVERFLKPFKGIEGNEEINEEFHRLASMADSFPKTLIHRDFQSQNIMIKGRRPYIIDYQGMRLGPPGYDLVSLLWDPYYRLEEGGRERLLEYYIRRAEELITKFDKEIFRKSIPVLRLQRHMQCLGAYGFLSMVKGKRHFLKYIPEALRLLKEEIEPMKAQFPYLYELITSKVAR